MQTSIEQIFVHAPNEFLIGSPRLRWNPPCYFELDVDFSPQTQAAWEAFSEDFTLLHQVDALARRDHLKQLWASFYSYRIQLIKGKFHSAWLDAFLKLHDSLKKCLEHPDRFLIPPRIFVPRKQFTSVDLRTILQEDPSQIDVYVISEERKYGEDCFLRIHTSVSSVIQQKRYLWFEKRMPWRLHREDIMPWFLATIGRLPKKAQPSNLHLWRERLILFEPDLAVQNDGLHKAWLKKPKIILVLGPETLVGYRGLFHLERQNIDCIRRYHEVVTIIGQTKLRFANKTEFVESWRFHILTESESAACEIEKQILNGERIHFGLDLQIVGMIAHEHQRNEVYAINVPETLIRKLCLNDGQSLKLTSPPGKKRRSYEVS